MSLGSVLSTKVFKEKEDDLYTAWHKDAVIHLDVLSAQVRSRARKHVSYLVMGKWNSEQRDTAKKRLKFPIVMIMGPCTS